MDARKHKIDRNSKIAMKIKIADQMKIIDGVRQHKTIWLICSYNPLVSSTFHGVGVRIYFWEALYNPSVQYYCLEVIQLLFPKKRQLSVVIATWNLSILGKTEPITEILIFQTDLVFSWSQNRRALEKEAQLYIQLISVPHIFDLGWISEFSSTFRMRITSFQMKHDIHTCHPMWLRE